MPVSASKSGIASLTMSVQTWLARVTLRVSDDPSSVALHDARVPTANSAAVVIPATRKTLCRFTLSPFQSRRIHNADSNRRIFTSALVDERSSTNLTFTSHDIEWI